MTTGFVAEPQQSCALDVVRREHIGSVQTTAPCRSTARPAPLEQLRASGRELEGGILAIDTGSTRWLFDPARNAFQRIDREMDLSRAIAFGTWDTFTDLTWHDDDTLVIVPSGPRAQLRVQLQGV